MAGCINLISYKKCSTVITPMICDKVHNKNLFPALADKWTHGAADMTTAEH